MLLSSLDGSIRLPQPPIIFIDTIRTNPEAILIHSDDAIYRKIGTRSLYAIFSAANEASHIAQNLVGIAETNFYAISSLNKELTTAVYNEDTATQILSINANIRLLGKHTKDPADFITNTLTQMNEAVNQLIVDSSTNASQMVIEQDIAYIQAIVNSFKTGFAATLDHEECCKYTSESTSKAETALQEFANQVEVYIFQLKGLVDLTSPGTDLLLSSNYLLILNLRVFVEASAVAVYFDAIHNHVKD